MKALLSARRAKNGREEDFRQKWASGGYPEGMLAAYLLEDEQDPRETLSISFWDTAKNLLSYTTSDDAQKREKEMSDVVDKERWSRSFVAFAPWDVGSNGGKKKWFATPLLLAAAGGALWYFLKGRRNDDDDEWEDWQPDDPTLHQAVPLPNQDAENRTNGGSAPLSAVSPVTSGATPTTPVTSAGTTSATATPAASVSTPASNATAATTPSGSTQTSSIKMPDGGGRPMTEVKDAQRDAGRSTTAGSTAGSSATAPRASAASGPMKLHDRAAGKRVRDLMTKDPRTVHVDTSARDAGELMKEMNIGVLPVMAGGRLAAMITDRDLALGISERGADPSTIRVGDLATAAPVTVAPSATAEEAARLMADHQIRRLPVVDGAKLVGMLSLGDLAADGAPEAAGDALEEISEPAKPQR